jgi:hypothetical protein
MKPLITVPCQIALNDPVSGHSLIGVFHEIKVQISGDLPELPLNAMLPKEWAVFSKFGLTPEEEGREYSLKTDIYWPDGSLLLRNLLPAEKPTRNGMAFIVRLQAFPFGQPGMIRVVETLLSGDENVYGPIELEINVSVEKSLPAADSSQ